MAISTTQARAVTGLYSLGRQSGLLKTSIGRRLFAASYFLYKQYMEDPFANLIKRQPELFHGGDLLDIGANIGYTASLFAGAADKDAAVYAFEPEPFNFELLRAVLRNRKLQDRVIPIHSAIGEREGEIKLWINDRHPADHRIATDLRAQRHTQRCLAVPITTIDGFLSERKASRPICWIKIDVQGYEFAVCQGMDATIARQKQPLAVAVEYMPEAMAELGYDPPLLLDWFRQRGFKMYSLGKSGDLAPGLERELGEGGYVDLIFSNIELS